MARCLANECMQTQNLPLGADCLKYLEMTPKAPADIDKWMMEVPTANASDSVLTVRTIEVSHVSQLNETLVIPTPKGQQLPSREAFYALAFVYGCSILTLLYFIHRPPDAFWRIIRRLDWHSKRVIGFKTLTIIREFLQSRMGKGMLYLTKFMLVSLLLFDIYATILLWNSQYLIESWSATSDFLETCKKQKV
jgi:hypothetical protein